ncbi:hypothetical protein SAMN04488003_12126 [Loktanella fryxellensis]|uniref:Uncharacterized protein n=1 Tax=Loktanella fryxellensis TaxID=245187 RepID=A0A1H8HJP4_9RHOB|nr:hypothetical protein [Loktanella fryxellensis]SEN56285.1 hypothetical protein SAMN04488003_12126 [Loktanella fryxellensis]
MTVASHREPGPRADFWTGPRLSESATVSLVLIVFVAANAHRITVSFASAPDCVLHPTREGPVTYAAVKPSC